MSIGVWAAMLQHSGFLIDSFCGQRLCGKALKLDRSTLEWSSQEEKGLSVGGRRRGHFEVPLLPSGASVEGLKLQYQGYMSEVISHTQVPQSPDVHFPAVFGRGHALPSAEWERC